MLWTYTQNVGPLGTYQTTVSIGGSSWNVYKGSNGSNAVFSFVRTSNETSGSVNIAEHGPVRLGDHLDHRHQREFPGQQLLRQLLTARPRGRRGADPRRP